LNILYLNHYAGSPALGMEYRPYYLAREWVRAGHRVQMVAADHSHVRARQPAGGDETIDGIAYRWRAHAGLPGQRRGPRRTSGPFCGQVWATRRACARFQARCGDRVQHLPDGHLGGAPHRPAGPGRLVFEVHDLWPLSPIELSACRRATPSSAVPARRRPPTATPTRGEHAAKVVHDYMASRGLDLRKLHIVPNGITLDEWQGDAAGAARRPCDGRWRRRAAAGARWWAMPARWACPMRWTPCWTPPACCATQPMQLRAGGRRPRESERLAQRVRAEGLAHVCAAAAHSQGADPGFLAAVDIAYIGWQRVPIYRFGIAPNKLMDYMMAALRGAAFGGGRQRPGGRSRLRADRAARVAARRGRRPAPPGRAAGSRAPGDGRAGPRLRAGPPHLPGAGATLPAGAAR
jgi:hypothetical protein